MKKIIIVALIISLLFACAGCKNSENKVSINKVSKEKKENTLVTEIPYKGNWLQSDLSAVGIKSAVAEHQKDGYIVGGSNGELIPCRVYLLSVYDEEKYGKNSGYHDSFLAIETESKVRFENVSKKMGSYFDNLYVCDIDGEKGDEIVLQQVVGITGGAGQYLSRIYKVGEKEIKEIFSSVTGEKFDTGFKSEARDGFKVEITNIFTKSITVLDFSKDKEYKGVYFDQSGAVIQKATILCDSFESFVPLDKDADGIFEIECSQYVSLYGHSDYIGDAKTVLKYNSDLQKMEIIEASFQPYD